MKTVVSIAAAGLLLIGAHTAVAQQPWSFEVRGGVALPTQNFASSDLGTGYGLEGTVGYRFLPHLGAYAGWDWMHFPADEGRLVASDFDVEETGYAFGLQFEHPLRPGPAPLLRIRAGGTYDHIEIEDAGGAITADSDHGFGWEAGTGILFPLGQSWRFTPGVRYRALTRDVAIGSSASTRDVDLTYVTVELGLSRRF